MAPNPTIGSAEWGFTNAIASIVVAILGPILGAIADNTGYRKRWLGTFTFLCILMTASLWFVAPSPEYVSLGLTLAGIGIIASETAFVFYNAMLPELASHDQIGRWSGCGWAMGYVGGMACLLTALFFLSQPNSIENNILQIHTTFLLAACWYALFSLPLFFFTPSTHKQKKDFGLAIHDGLQTLWITIKNVRHYRVIVQFLIARMFYLDGLTTLFIFGGVYAAVTFNMNDHEILVFAIALNISAGIGAIVFSWIDDWIGSKKLILISICGLIIFTMAMLLITSTQLFWLLGLCLGIFVGPVQSASRSFLARLAPLHLRNEMFGFFALSGKATAFLGPTLVSAIMLYTGSQRLGLLIIVLFFLIGGALMLKIPEN